ncbi:MAG: GTP-binding protein [Candidatus Lokiarchaeota archaeon]|nr:GTP-binding protein [Candidatus Lokiarchaeota archaeon]
MTGKVVKMALVGAGGAGKTTIASRLITGEFIETLMTIGINIETWKLEDDASDSDVTVALFDLGGQNQFRFFQKSLLSGTHAVILVVDMTRLPTLFELDDWIKLIQHVDKEMWLLVGNKCDDHIMMTEDDIRKKAEEIGIPYVILSAKTGEGFDELVERIIDMMRN